MKWFGVFRVACLLFTVCGGLGLLLGEAAAQAQQTPSTTPPPAKVQELIKLLDDPEIRAWLQDKPEAETADASPAAVEQIFRWEVIIRGRFASLYACHSTAWHRIWRMPRHSRCTEKGKFTQGRPGTVIGHVVSLLIAIGYGAEWLFSPGDFGASEQRPDPTPCKVETVTGSSACLQRSARYLFSSVLLALVCSLRSNGPPVADRSCFSYLLAFGAFRADVTEQASFRRAHPGICTATTSGLQDLTSPTGGETSL